MKKVICILVLVTLLATITIGCAEGVSETPSAAPATSAAPEETQAEATGDALSGEEIDSGDVGSPEIVVGGVLLDLTAQFYTYMIEGADIAAEEEGVRVEWRSADGNLDNQIALMENFIQQDVDVILIDPLDVVGLIPVCEEAIAAGIPVITIANVVEAEGTIATLYNDYRDTKIVGHILANLIGQEGEVGLLYGAAGNMVSDERQRGFQEAMAEYPGITIVSELPTGWDTAVTLKAAQDMLASYPNLKAIHSFSDGMTVALYQAVEQADKLNDVLITSFDGNPDASQAVADGKYVNTVLTGAKRVGYWNIKLAAQLARGETLPARNYLESHLIVNDDLRAKIEEWDIPGIEEINIVTPQEGIALFDDMSAGFDIH